MKPEILCHPHIPKPLHGLSPRTIMGQEWWDKERQRVYASIDYHCVACGVAKKEAKRHRWLEAHEYWKIDYTTGICEILSIEPLCHYCHNFIHSGRLLKIMGNEKFENEVIDILEHGLQILSKSHLECFLFTLDLAESLGCNEFGVKAYRIESNPKLKWDDWKLIWQGKEYRSKFSSYREWEKFYGRRNPNE